MSTSTTSTGDVVQGIGKFSIWLNIIVLPAIIIGCLIGAYMLRHKYDDEREFTARCDKGKIKGCCVLAPSNYKDYECELTVPGLDERKHKITLERDRLPDSRELTVLYDKKHDLIELRDPRIYKTLPMVLLIIAALSVVAFIVDLVFRNNPVFQSLFGLDTIVSLFTKSR